MPLPQFLRPPTDFDGLVLALLHWVHLIFSDLLYSWSDFDNLWCSQEMGPEARVVLTLVSAWVVLTQVVVRVAPMQVVVVETI